MNEVKERAKKIKLVILDVDGVMTDGQIVLDGEREIRAFDIKDGLGTLALQMLGVETAIMTSLKSPVVAQRARELRIKRFYEGVRNKAALYQEVCQDMRIADEEVCYVGDDLMDLGIMKRVGLAVAVADAVDEIKKVAHYITQAPGGHGAVREVAELILKAQDKWEALLEKIERL